MTELLSQSTASRRFMFDQSFDLTALKAAEEKATAIKFSEEEVALARDQAYGQGFVAGKEAALREMEQKQQEILGNIQILFERMADEIWKSSAERKEAAASIAVTIARKIVPEFLRKHGADEIVAAIEPCLSEMINEPRLVLRIAEAHFDKVSAAINAMTSRLGYAGKMIILADNTLTEHDCRLEWADGGMERIVNLTWSDIERALNHRPHTAPNPHHAHAAQDAHGTSTNIAV